MFNGASLENLSPTGTWRSWVVRWILGWILRCETLCLARSLSNRNTRPHPTLRYIAFPLHRVVVFHWSRSRGSAVSRLLKNVFSVNLADSSLPLSLRRAQYRILCSWYIIYQVANCVPFLLVIPVSLKVMSRETVKLTYEWANFELRSACSLIWENNRRSVSVPCSPCMV